MATESNSSVRQTDEKRSEAPDPAGQSAKGSAFNEKPMGRKLTDTFTQTGSSVGQEDEKDILSETPQKAKPQQDADV